MSVAFPVPSSAHSGKPNSGLRSLHPAYFALVMATGIVSIAGDLLGMPRLAGALFLFNIVAYFVLGGLTLARLAYHADAVLGDLFDHNRCVGFFTSVAATCILANQCLLIGMAPRLALALGVLGFILWAVLTYSIFTILTVKSTKPSLSEGINGGWLVAIVATQSVSIVAANLAMSWGGSDPVLFVALVMWLGGGMLYLWMISLIFYRYTFFTFRPSDLAPPYWINMGAVAISTLAGTLLVKASPDAPFLLELLPFLKGFTLFFWATATWWIPMLVILGFWRHLYQQFPLRYDPLYWGAVFPLGMYTAATWQLATAIELPFLTWISRGFIWIALIAWTLTCYGMLSMLVRKAFGLSSVA